MFQDIAVHARTSSVSESFAAGSPVFRNTLCAKYNTEKAVG
jgi:hypothetical protein